MTSRDLAASMDASMDGYFIFTEEDFCLKVDVLRFIGQDSIILCTTSYHFECSSSLDKILKRFSLVYEKSRLFRPF